jgi:hypothetical protein
LGGVEARSRVWGPGPRRVEGRGEEAGPGTEAAAAPSWLQLPPTPTPDTHTHTHTHTHTQSSVCPSGICVPTISAQCVNIYGGLRWRRGV